MRTRDDTDEHTEFVRDLQGWLLVLPPGAAFTHVTGARLRGWKLPQLPEQVPIFAAIRGDISRPRRPGLICSRLVHPSTRGECHGLPVDSAEEILLRACRDLGVLDVVIMLDAARRAGDLDDRRMEELIATRRPGVRQLRRAYELSDALAESAGETVLRLFHRMCDVTVQPQVDLHDGSGAFLGRADLLVTGTHLVHEYDGAGHRDGGQHRSDLRRERALAGAGYDRRGFTLDDLLNKPTTVMHEIDRALDRRHDQRRIRRWRALVDDSLYAEAGRERVMNRWRRQASIDWSATA
ncbi:unannotated protein [freshwater metagenome]|uniref:Unannotated protein n=1 Tax=freshwater metagenome TaxID=449393 RepID=A0A6J6RSV4_9ZZZZ